MNKNIIALPLIALLSVTAMSGCSTSSNRIEPGSLQISENSQLHSAKIINIIQLSEEELTDKQENKALGANFAGVVIGSLLSGDSYVEQEVGSFVGLVASDALVTNKMKGKTVYRLTLALDNKTIKETYVRGGNYNLGNNVRVTVDKSTGKVNSFKA